MNNNVLCTYPPYIERNYVVGDLVNIGLMKCDYAVDKTENGESHLAMNTYATFDKTTTGMILHTPTVEKNQNNTMFILLVNEQVGVFPHWMIRPLKK